MLHIGGVSERVVFSGTQGIFFRGSFVGTQLDRIVKKSAISCCPRRLGDFMKCVLEMLVVNKKLSFMARFAVCWPSNDFKRLKLVGPGPKFRSIRKKQHSLLLRLAVVRAYHFAEHVDNFMIGLSSYLVCFFPMLLGFVTGDFAVLERLGEMILSALFEENR